MPKILVIDGPEKAGKSTLINLVRDAMTRKGWMTLTHHWRGHQPDHYVHKRVLLQQLEAAKMLEYTTGRPGLILWDRSQASEAIYSQLLNRGGELADSPLIGEFMYGRIQQALGPRLILLGPDVSTLESLRDHTDLPVDPGKERAAYQSYGETYNWEVIENDQSLAYMTALADRLIRRLEEFPEIDPLSYIGPPEARLIAIKARISLESIPFVSYLSAKQWLPLGPRIMQYGYATVDCPRHLLLAASEVAIPDRSALLFNFVRYYLGFNPNQIRHFKDIIQEQTRL